MQLIVLFFRSMFPFKKRKKNQNITFAIKNPFVCNFLCLPFLCFSRNKSSNLNKQIPL